MKKSAAVKTVLVVGLCMFAGVLSVQCGPVQPVGGEPPLAGNVPTAGTDNGAGGNKAIVTLPTTAGTGGSAGLSSGTDNAVPASADANCGIQTSAATPQPVDLLLLLDRSGSMADDIATDNPCTGGLGGRFGAAPCSPKWPAMTSSLNQVLASSPAAVQWGLKFFSSPKGQACTVSPGADVAVGPNTAAKIQAAMAGTSPENNTPTMAAINAAVAYFGAVNDSLAHYVLLATDGLPNCDPGTSGVVTNTSVNDAANAIAAAFNAGMKTYVVGIGASAGNLDDFARAGGTGHYFPATSPDQLTAALGSIVVAVTSCTFTMAAVPPDPNNLGVYLDKNTRVPANAENGYSLGADGTTVTFSGSFCDGIRNGTYQVMQVYFGCPSGASPPEVIP